MKLQQHTSPREPEGDGTGRETVQTEKQCEMVKQSEMVRQGEIERHSNAVRQSEIELQNRAGKVSEWLFASVSTTVATE